MAKGMTIRDRDMGWGRIKKELRNIKKKKVHVGILSSAGNYPADEGGANYAYIGSIHEFGSEDGTIPERPFMRRAFRRNSKEISKAKAKLLDKIYAGSLTTKMALGKLGAIHQGHIFKIFTTGRFRRLKKATIARRTKKSTRPLIDTGVLRSKISYEVKGAR